jgi:hypothetical protein
VRSTPINYSPLSKLNGTFGTVGQFGTLIATRIRREAQLSSVKSEHCLKRLKDAELAQLRIKASIAGNPKGGGNGAGAFGSFWQDKRNTPAVSESF